mgnify:CR=1 FL=1
MVKLNWNAVVPWALAVSAFASTCDAQERRGSAGPLSVVVDSLVVGQGKADLDGGGSFKAQRAFLRAGALYRFGGGVSAGLFVSGGRLDYDFNTPSPVFEDINDLSISVPIRFPAGENVSVFLAPSLRYDYERGASRSEGQTYGVFGGAAWKVSDSLTIGPALGAFTQVEDESLRFFPALLVDWDISDKWNLSTGTGLGATQGPGLTLSYATSDKLKFGISARYENIRFRLNDQGPAPNGVGQDRSLPVVFSVDYEPFPRSSISAFVGAEFNGQLRLEDSQGNRIETRDYDPAPLVGAAIRLAF